MADLGAIEEDVPFDFGAADRLARVCDAAASAVAGQTGSRAGWVRTASRDFRGYFSELFADNASTASADAGELSDRLREVARGARRLAEEARKEQKRREVARKWKYEHDHRSTLDKIGDALFGEDSPPVGPPAAPVHVPVSPPRNAPRKTPAPGSGGGGGGGTSSARPEDLRSFARNSRHANEELRPKLSTTRGAYASFESGCQWGSLDASGVFAGFEKWLSANDEDVRWATVVADAFARAGGEGAVSTLANSAIAATLKAHGVSAVRQDLSIDPPTAYGHPPTTGYADDPVNTSTGNFVETEVDLEFTDGAAELTWSRSYNSLNATAGAFGPGWSSWTEAGLRFSDEAASFLLPEGRQVLFPRLGDGWDRATGENLWLERAGERWVVSANDGTRWSCTVDGHLAEVSHGEGTGVRLVWEQGRLVRLAHERGRSLTLTWDEVAGADRVVAVSASDGRAFCYEYDEVGRLLAATGPLGARSYRWNDAGLIEAVIDADGVVEVENDYDEHGRVARQRSPFGRVSRFVYLPGRVTVVSDEAGSRSNTWIADERGRLVGVVDAHEQRQSTAYDADGNPVLVTGRDGATTVTEYDSRGRRVRQVTPSGATVRWTYDAEDRISTLSVGDGQDGESATTVYEYAGADRNPSVVVDPEGGRTQLTWSRGLLRRVVDPTGVEVGFSHDDHGDLVAITDGLGNAARLERDETGRVVAAITPSGHRTRYGYDPATGLLAERVDPDGATWRFEYTSAGRRRVVVDPAGGRTEVEYGTHGEEIRTIDPLGRAVTRNLDDLGNLASVELPDGTTWRFTHDALSRLTSVLAPTGGAWLRHHDTTGDLVAVTDPTGATTHFTPEQGGLATRLEDGVSSAGLEVDKLGRLVAETQPDGSARLTRYDRCGRPVEVIDPAGGLTRIERDPAGRVVAVVRPSGARIEHRYDACGRLAAVTDETGSVNRFEYDADGRVVAQQLPTGEVATTRYDECGRVVARRIPGVGTTTWRYDRLGRVTESRDPQLGRRRFRYDAAGQLVAAVDGTGAETRYDYDVNGRCVTITHPDGGVTRRVYDAGNHVVAETDPLGRTTRAGYDEAGRQLWQIDPSGSRTQWRYDASGRFAGLVVDGVETSSVERDLPGRRLRVTDRSGPGGAISIHELEWDARGLLVSRTRDGRGLRWEYDADGHRAAMTMPDGTRVTYTRDGAGRLLAVDHPLLGRASLTRDAAGRIVSATAPAAAGVAGVVTESWTYADGFVVAHDSAIGSTRLERDDDGRITALVQGGARTRFTYDQACQLLAAHTTYADTEGEAESVARWRYDASGRLVAETVDSAGVRTTRELDYDPAGQLQSVRAGGEEIATYSYDATGRRTGEVWADGTRRDYVWSPTGWLAGLSVTDAAGGTDQTRVGVDALGELAWVAGPAGLAEAFSDTANPWEGLVALGDQTLTHAGPFTGTSAHGWASAGWRPDRATDADPWEVAGAPTPGTAGTAASLTATGALVLGGLEWLGHRLYDPQTRAFVSVDPLDPVVGAAWSGNPYAYAGNDPLHALDPLGLRPVTDAELRAYAAQHAGAIHAAGQWLANNWEYVAGGAMVVAGGVLIATGVGGPAGMMLVSAGADTIIQKATTGHVNWGEVAISGAMGAWGAEGAAVRLGAKTALQRAVVGGMVSGGTNGAAGSAYTYATGPGPHDVGGFLQATGAGAGVGMVSGGALGGAGRGLASIGRAGRHLGDVAPTPPTSHGVSFFGEDVVQFYKVGDATLGRPGGEHFFMPVEDSGVVRNAADAARYTGMAPSARNAYLAGGDVYGISFPTDGLAVHPPTAADAGGYEHFLEGGHTAVRTADPRGGYLVNQTREFVTPGGGPVPRGSVLFRLGDGGAWEPLRRF